MDDDLKMFAGGLIAVLLFGLLGLWRVEAMNAAIQGFNVLLGAAAMKMKGNA